MELRKRQAEELAEVVNHVPSNPQMADAMTGSLLSTKDAALPVVSNSSEEVVKVKQWVEDMKRSVLN